MKNALLLISSPLQLINVRAAIFYFQITDYKLLIFKDNNSDRHNQVINLAEFYGMSYLLVDYRNDFYINKIHFIYSFLKSILVNWQGKFDIILHGDYRNFYLTISFYSLLKRKGIVCFVDDGNATINIFEGKDVDQKGKILYKILNFSVKIRNRNTFKYFTLYDDLETNMFDIIPNQYFTERSLNQSDKTIYIIGTNTILYVEYLGISLDKFIYLFRNFLDELKHIQANSHIVYIPHGRDICNDILDICVEKNIEYIKMNECVESFFAKKNTFPAKVYAFTSSALFNIKKMYPQTDCYNIAIEGEIEEHQNLYNKIHSYYEKHYIKTINLCKNVE